MSKFYTFSEMADEWDDDVSIIEIFNLETIIWIVVQHHCMITSLMQIKSYF